MGISLYFLRKRWAYVINVIFLIPTAFSVITFVTFFIVVIRMAVMIGLGILIFGINNLRMFFSKEVREYFGYEIKEEKSEQDIDPSGER
jgi:Sec-independent protein secretion pathway component TatC